MTDRYAPRHATPPPRPPHEVPIQAVADLLSAIRATLPDGIDAQVAAARVTIGNILRDGVTEFSLKTTAAFLREDFPAMMAEATARAAAEVVR